MKIINGDVNLEKLILTELPDLQDVQVRGGFYCNENYLQSLKGAPTYVRGDFWCKDNRGIEITEEMIREVCDVKGKVSV